MMYQKHYISKYAKTGARAFGIGVLRLIRIEEVVGSIPTTSIESPFFAPYKNSKPYFLVYSTGGKSFSTYQELRFTQSAIL